MTRQCGNGVVITFSLNGIVSDHLVREYRCTLEAGHEGNHRDGDMLWSNY